MNLYLLTQSENGNYDTYDSAIVASENEEDAKLVCPGDSSVVWQNERWEKPRFDGVYFPVHHWSSDWASHPNNVTARLIGKAVEGTEYGLILGSFNAG